MDLDEREEVTKFEETALGGNHTHLVEKRRRSKRIKAECFPNFSLTVSGLEMSSSEISYESSSSIHTVSR